MHLAMDMGIAMDIVTGTATVSAMGMVVAGEGGTGSNGGQFAARRGE
jgi:hypothetical protein